MGPLVAELLPPWFIMSRCRNGFSASDWKFAADQFKSQFGDEVLVHCSSRNAATLTFDGVDVMGHRLAEEVKEVVEGSPGLTRISFIAHSLGGLIASGNSSSWISRKWPGDIHKTIHFFILDDKQHDTHFVQHCFLKHAEWLKQFGLNIKRHWVWSDGAASQFKARRPFYFLASFYYFKRLTIKIIEDT
ncbi:hypothetical protein GOP47_0008079, partial [Adiantum capillus-veneris]